MAKYELFEQWERENATLRAEFVGGDVSVTFTGRVIYYSATELRLARSGDEMSISFFCAQVKLYSKVEGGPDAVSHFQENYVRAVRITTELGVTCMVYELRNQN